MHSYINRLKTIWTHPANRNFPLKAILRALHWQLTSKQTGTPVDIDAFGYSMRLYPDAFQTRGIIYCTPFKEYHSMKFIERYLDRGDSFIDIGANIGIYSLLASSIVGKNGSVESFEPCPAKYTRLQENITRNQITQINLHQIAIGETEETVEFTTEYDALNFIAANSSDITSQTVSVPCKRLDTVLKSSHQFSMAKLDVEGYEFSALKGASAFLKNGNPPVIQLEINGSFYRYGITKEQLIDFLKEYGYESAQYNATTNQLYFTEEVWDEVLFINQQYKETILNKLEQLNM